MVAVSLMLRHSWRSLRDNARWSSLQDGKVIIALNGIIQCSAVLGGNSNMSLVLEKNKINVAQYCKDKVTKAKLNH